MIGDHRRREESGHFEPAVAVRRTHHGNLDAHVAQSSDAICPVSFDWGAPLELEAKFREELDGGIDVFYHDADVVHALDRHHVSLASNARGERQPTGTGPGTAKKPALWAVRSSALFGAVLGSGRVHVHWSPLLPNARLADPVDFLSATLR